MKSNFCCLKDRGELAMSNRLHTDRTVIHSSADSVYVTNQKASFAHDHLTTHKGIDLGLASAAQDGCLDEKYRAHPFLCNFGARPLKRNVTPRRLAVALLLCGIMSGCASLPSPTADPNACVGPPDYCVPFFGS